MPPPADVRFLPEPELRCVAPPDGGPPTISGYAAVFNSPSVDLGKFREVIRPGAFTRNLMGADILALVGHDVRAILGRTKAGTLRLAQDPRGLRFEADLPDTSYARDLARSIERGDISGMSFRFYTPEGGDSWSVAPDGYPLRELRDIEIDEISVVTLPAYQATEVSIRSLDALASFRSDHPAPTPRRDRATRLLRLVSAAD